MAEDSGIGALTGDSTLTPQAKLSVAADGRLAVLRIGLPTGTGPFASGSAFTSFGGVARAAGHTMVLRATGAGVALGFSLPTSAGAFFCVTGFGGLWANPRSDLAWGASSLGPFSGGDSW